MVRAPGGRKQVFRPFRGMQQSVVPIMREKEMVLHLADVSGQTPLNSLTYTSDGGLVGRLKFQLTDVPNHAEFQALFREYKINYVSLHFIPAQTTTDNHEGIMLRTCLNRSFTDIGAGNTVGDWSQIQAKSSRALPAHRDFKIKCTANQLAFVSEQGSLYTGYATARPRYCALTEPQIDHYGLNVRFDAIDGTTLSASETAPSYRVVCRYYMTFRGLK